jgi:hypothetical protein
VCHNMKATTLGDVLGCLQGTAGEEITAPLAEGNQLFQCFLRIIHKKVPPLVLYSNTNTSLAQPGAKVNIFAGVVGNPL